MILESICSTSYSKKMVGFELHTLHHSREQNRSSKPTYCPRPNWPQKMESSGIPSSLLDLDWFCKKQQQEILAKQIVFWGHFVPLWEVSKGLILLCPSSPRTVSWTPRKFSKPTYCPCPNWPQKTESSGIPSSLLDLDWFCKKLIIPN